MLQILSTLKGFSEEWRAIGFVPRKNMDDLVSSFSKAMDAHYDALAQIGLKDLWQTTLIELRD